MQNVYQAITVAAKNVGPVTKERASGLRYTIVTKGAILSAARDSLIDAGLVAIPIKTAIVSTDSWSTTSGGSMTRVVVSVVTRIAHGESDTHVDVESLGEAADSSDKAVAKALTIAKKSMLRQLLLIETGNDPDTSRPEPSGAVKRAGSVSNGDGNKKTISSTAPVSNVAPRAIYSEIECLISQLPDPNAALSAILTKRCVGSIAEISDADARELREKLALKVLEEFFDDPESSQQKEPTNG